MNLNTTSYTSEPSGGWLKCENSRMKIEQRSGIINLPSTCSISSKGKTIMGRLGVSSYSDLFLIPHEKLSLNEETILASETASNLTPMPTFAEITVTPDIILPVDYKDNWFSAFFKGTWHIFVAICSTLASILLIALLSYGCYRCCCQNPTIRINLPAAMANLASRHSEREDNKQPSKQENVDQNDESDQERIKLKTQKPKGN